MNNKKLLIINIITLIVFIVVVGIGLNQSGYTKSDSNQTEEKSENDEAVGIERVMQFVSLKQSILQTKLPALQLAIEEEPEEDEEKDIMELVDREEEVEDDSVENTEQTVDEPSVDFGNNNGKNNNTNHNTPTTIDPPT